MADIVPLSAADRAQLAHLVETTEFRNVPAYALISQEQPHLRVFYAAFDGTANDRDAVPKGEQMTLVAQFEKDLPNRPELSHHYYEGVGTRTPAALAAVEQATGAGCAERAERAYQDLQAAVARWKAEDPLVQVAVHSTGFSRGGASALHFMNLVDERGMGAGAQDVPFRQTAVLFDVVATGQTDDLKLAVPKSAVGVLHLTAEDEHRRLFSLTSTADPRAAQGAVTIAHDVLVLPAFTGGAGAEPSRTTAVYRPIIEQAMPGAHSDVGGAYADGKLREVSAYLAGQYQEMLGIPTHAAKPSLEVLGQAYAHDSRWALDKVVDALEGHVATRKVHEGQTPNWEGATSLLVTASHAPTLLLGMANNDKVQLPVNTPVALFQEPLKLRVYLDQGQVKFESNRPEAFSYDAKADRMLFMGQPTAALGVTSQLSEHLKQGEMRFELKAQRDIQHVREPLQGAVRPTTSPPPPEALDRLSALLKAAPANTILQARDQITPLMVAARAGLPDVVTDLLARGADPSLRNREGKTAADLALDNTTKALLDKAAQREVRPERER